MTMKKLSLLITLLFPFLTNAQHGVLDPDFDADGIASFEIGNQGYTDGYDIAVQQDGKILVLGETELQNPINEASYLLRLFPDGSVDPSFGQNGIVLLDDVFARQMTIQPDGKIVVVGAGEFNNSDAIAFARLNGTDGSKDVSFGVNGTYFIPFPQGSFLMDVALQSDGKILAVGFTTESDTDVLLVRLNQDGTPDNMFSFDGVVKTDVNSVDEARGLVIGDDGKITIVGTTEELIGNFTNRLALLIRYNPDGSLDNSFGTNGILIPDFVDAAVLNDITWGESGKMYACGIVDDATDEDFLVAKFNIDGTFDMSFGGSGFEKADFDGDDDEAKELVYQPDGRILAVGDAVILGSAGAMVRFNADGTYDQTFGNGGFVTTSIDIGNVYEAVALQEDLRILTVGRSITQTFDEKANVARYTSGMNVGIEEVEASIGSTLIYPNPITDNHLTVEYELTSKQTVSIEFVDLYGKFISVLQPEAEEAVGSYQKQLDLGNVPSGNYLLRLRTDKGAVTVKVTVS